MTMPKKIIMLMEILFLLISLCSCKNVIISEKTQTDSVITTDGKELFSEELCKQTNSIIYYPSNEEGININNTDIIRDIFELLQAENYTAIENAETDNQTALMNIMEFESAENQCYIFAFNTDIISYDGKSYKAENGKNLSTKLINLINSEMNQVSNTELPATLTGKELFSDMTCQIICQITFSPFNEETPIIIKDSDKIQAAMEILQSENYTITNKNDMIEGMYMFDFVTDSITYGVSVSTNHIAFEGTQYEAVSGTDLSASIFEILEIDTTVSGDQVFTDELAKSIRSIIFYPFDDAKAPVIEEDPAKIENIMTILMGEDYQVSAKDNFLTGEYQLELKTENETYGLGLNGSNQIYFGNNYQFEAISGKNLSLQILTIMGIEIEE